jgi:hypothetical protein
MAEDPAQVLPKFVSLAMEMAEGVSAPLDNRPHAVKIIVSAME